MVKPYWGDFQQRFLSEYVAIGVSPKEWCEAQGLNYATARRYIKKPSAQTAQKGKCPEEQVESILSPKVKRFIAEYLKEQNATAVAERARYCDRYDGSGICQRKAEKAPSLRDRNVLCVASIS